MESSILAMSDAVKAKLALNSHPVSQQELPRKVNYLNGIALMMNVDGAITESQKNYFVALIEAFDMDKEMADEFIEFANNPDEELFKELMEDIKQDDTVKELFMVDAIVMAKKDGKLDKNEETLIKNYFEMLSFSSGKENKIRNIAEIIDSQDEEEALIVYITDEQFYHKFSYLFDFLGFDSKRKKQEIFHFEWVKWNFFNGGVINDNLVSRNPVTNRQYALFLNAIIKENVMQEQATRFIKDTHLIIDLADSAISFNEEKRTFTCEQKDENLFVTGVAMYGVRAFVEWMQKYVDEAVYWLFLYSDGSCVLSADSASRPIGFTNNNELFALDRSELFCVTRDQRLYLDTSSAGLSESYTSANVVFRLMKTKKKKQ